MWFRSERGRNEEHAKIYLIPPTSTVTSTALIVLATLKVLESTTLMLPPGCLVPLTLESGKVKGSGALFGITKSFEMSSGGGVAGVSDDQDSL
jgi:hypothetical protein